ncbi:MAG: hypothetical protein ACOY0S_00845 [Patescibacteria group bacterium]
MIPKDSFLWQYLSLDLRRLATDGEFLITDRQAHPTQELSDHSYLVFPFAKLYEGFLKRLFLDLAIITERDYRSDHFRIGKVLSPNLARRLRERSAYSQLTKRFGRDLAERLWNTWRQARNLVFHYFPHNFRALTQKQALDLIELISATMNSAVVATGVRPDNSHIAI